MISRLETLGNCLILRSSPLLCKKSHLSIIFCMIKLNLELSLKKIDENSASILPSVSQQHKCNKCPLIITLVPSDVHSKDLKIDLLLKKGLLAFRKYILIGLSQNSLSN